MSAAPFHATGIHLFFTKMQARQFISLATILLFVGIFTSARGQGLTSSNKLTLINSSHNKLELRSPASAFTNYSLSFPSSSPGTGGIPYFSNSTGQFAWLPAGIDGQVLTLSSGVPVWSSALLLTGWSVTGNSILTAYNGTIGSYLGTANTQPLVLATTNTITPQPIKFFTNNTERVRIASSGELLVGTTTPQAALTVNGETYTNSIRYSTSMAMPTPIEGRAFYDSVNHCLKYFNEDLTNDVCIGREMIIRAKNTSGATIPMGAAVYITGSDAATRLPTIALGKADQLATADIIGLASTPIPNNSVGYLNSFGVIDSINTSAYSNGAVLYLSPTTAGAVTTIRPTLPNFTNPVGYVSYVATAGEIIVNIGKTRQGAMTAGALAFGGADGFIKEYPTKLFFDSANFRLGIGTNTPTQLLEAKNGNLLLSNSTTTAGQLQLQGTSTGISTFQSGAQGAINFNYTLPTTSPSVDQMLTATAVSGSAITLGWSNPAASTSVKYNTPSVQATATPRGNYLFNVEYASGSGNTSASGARISSSSGNGSGDNTTGLTVVSTVNNNGTSTGQTITATVGGANSNATGLVVNATGSGSGTAKGLTVAVGGGTTNYAALFSGGNVGIDTATPGSKLSVNGEMYSKTILMGGNTHATPYAEGRIFYDTIEHALTYFNDVSTKHVSIGQENLIRIKNVSGATIPIGAAVYINGSDIASGLPTIALAKADQVVTADVLGLCQVAIANNAIGYINSFGAIDEFNTTAFTPGATLYLSATTAGGLTSTRPSQPNFTNPIGYVSKVAVAGAIIVTGGKLRQGSMTPGAIAFGGYDGFVRESPQKLFFDSVNQRLGIGTNAPGTNIDLTGDISIRFHGITLSADSVNDLDVGAFSYVGITGRTNNYVISGIAGGTDGKQIQLINLTPKSMKLYHQSTASSSANRIYNPSGQDITIADSGTVGLVYNGLLNCWVVQSSVSAMTGTSAFTIRRQKTDVSITNSTTFQVASDFNFNAKPNSVYEIEIVIFDSGVGGAYFSGYGIVPTGSTLTGFIRTGINGHAAEDVDVIRNGTLSTGGGTNTMSGVAGYALTKAILTTGSTGGIITFAWGMLSSDATKKLWLFKDSYAIVRLIGKI